MTKLRAGEIIVPDPWIWEWAINNQLPSLNEGYGGVWPGEAGPRAVADPAVHPGARDGDPGYFGVRGCTQPSFPCFYFHF